MSDYIQSKEYELPDGGKAVFNYNELGIGEITIEAMDALMDIVNSSQQWIPCSERLPEEKDMVLVTRRSGAVDYVSWSDWWYKQDSYPYLKPIAWMPLPEPWKEVEDGEIH